MCVCFLLFVLSLRCISPLFLPPFLSISPFLSCSLSLYSFLSHSFCVVFLFSFSIQSCRLDLVDPVTHAPSLLHSLPVAAHVCVTERVIFILICSSIFVCVRLSLSLALSHTLRLGPSSIAMHYHLIPQPVIQQPHHPPKHLGGFPWKRKRRRGRKRKRRGGKRVCERRESA